jgi:hypothetical protein
VLVGARATAEVTIRNTSNVPEEQVMLRVFFPPNVAPDAANVQGPPGLPAPRLSGDTLSFDPVATIPPGEILRYVIPINPLESGIVPITAQAASRNVRQGVEHSVNLEIVGNRR